MRDNRAEFFFLQHDFSEPDQVFVEEGVAEYGKM